MGNCLRAPLPARQIDSASGRHENEKGARGGDSSHVSRLQDLIKLPLYDASTLSQVASPFEP
jgi:hypothetical protein